MPPVGWGRGWRGVTVVGSPRHPPNLRSYHSPPHAPFAAAESRPDGLLGPFESGHDVRHSRLVAWAQLPLGVVEGHGTRKLGGTCLAGPILAGQGLTATALAIQPPI